MQCSEASTETLFFKIQLKENLMDLEKACKSATPT